MEHPMLNFMKTWEKTHFTIQGGQEYQSGGHSGEIMSIKTYGLDLNNLEIEFPKINTIVLHE